MKKTKLAVALSLLCSTGAFAQVSSTTSYQEMNWNGVQWNMVGAPTAWARGYTGKGVTIGIVDTGVDPNQADLKGKIVKYGGYLSTGGDVYHGHGTWMETIAAGSKNGVGMVGIAPDANLVTFAAGPFGIITWEGVKQGLKFTADNGASVINLSLGTSMPTYIFNAAYTQMSDGSFKSRTGLDNYAPVADVAPYLQYATGKGSIVVIAAGNDGNPTPATPANMATQVDKNGNLVYGGKIIIVGAVDNAGNIASWSNRAGNICQTIVNNVCKDTVKTQDYFIVAPGTNILAGAAGYGSAVDKINGTSPAAAVVSGGVAILKQAWPTLKPEQIVQLLLTTAKDLGAKGTDPIYGRGMMDLDAATKPQGTLTLAKPAGASSTPVALGGMNTGTLVSLTKSDALTNAQALDGYGRNYTVNMNKAIMAGFTGYNQNFTYSGYSKYPLQYASNRINNVEMEFGSSADTMAVRTKVHFKDQWFGFESGQIMEKNGLLGSQGVGAMNPGSGTTNWVGVHAGKDITQQLSVYGGIINGYTSANAAADSMITGYSNIQTRSWNLGVKHKDNFVNKDELDFKMTVLPYVTSGTATVQSVTGYNYATTDGENYTATPITSKENVDLRTSYRQYALGVSYNVPLNRQTNMFTSVTALVDSLGQRAGNMAFVGIQARF
jgi:subtilisin family serine protease